jgi:hypothetical protein
LTEGRGNMKTGGHQIDRLAERQGVMRNEGRYYCQRGREAWSHEDQRTYTKYSIFLISRKTGNLEDWKTDTERQGATKTCFDRHWQERNKGTENQSLAQSES